MIKLKLPLQTAILYAKNDPDSAYAQAALVAHAYQEALEQSYPVVGEFVDRRAAELLKEWGIE